MNMLNWRDNKFTEIAMTPEEIAYNNQSSVCLERERESPAILSPTTYFPIAKPR